MFSVCSTASTLQTIRIETMTPLIPEITQALEEGSISLQSLLLLRRQLKAPFRLHPLGFIACTLLSDGPRKIRLHYWPVAGASQQSSDCQIHDHLFEFKSWVFAGEVQNIEYSVSHSQSGSEMAEYRTEYVDDLSILSKTGRTLRLQETCRTTYGTGSKYSLAAGVLHETIRLGMEPAFTVLVAHEVSAAPPLVLGRCDGENRYVYRREQLEESIVQRILAGA
jgi:hypothetical protein